jgi:hypothetical protein
MRGYQIVLIAAGAALAAMSATLVVTGYVHVGKPGHDAHHLIAGSTAPAPRPSPVNASRAPATLETNPALAMRYAENAVGSCLQNAWGNAGYTNVFDSYRASGVVEFSTGTLASPTGNYGDATLIDVHVYTDRKVTGMAGGGAGGPPPTGVDNGALNHWRCLPSKDTPSGPHAQPSAAARPPGLQTDGPLDVGCKLHGQPGYTSFQATVTLFNPGANAQNVSSFVVEWGSNGVLLSQNTISGPWSVPAQNKITLTIPGPPPSATSCVFAGWNK